MKLEKMIRFDKKQHSGNEDLCVIQFDKHNSYCFMQTIILNYIKLKFIFMQSTNISTITSICNALSYCMCCLIKNVPLF